MARGEYPSDASVEYLNGPSIDSLVFNSSLAPSQAAFAPATAHPPGHHPGVGGHTDDEGVRRKGDSGSCEHVRWLMLAGPHERLVADARAL
jgi:hypothetical protein